MSQQYPFQCNIAQALNIIGDKWSLLILHGIMSGHQTYKEIYNSLEGQIASNLLSSRLKAAAIYTRSIRPAAVIHLHLLARI